MYEDMIIDALKISIFYYEFRGIMGPVITVLGTFSMAMYTTSSYHQQEESI